mmetsp:Transcript_5443/g.7354  ORF Transcript_5443/g.7354 Transcript_5443/m.7354 type:complete len:423 (-) Transcript_5443:47-1315(-)
MLRLLCPAQNYDWGKKGTVSEVARLYHSNSGKEISDLPYAELWCGTHPSGPSILAGETAIPLKKWIQDHPETLGKVVHDKWGAELPFLLKVLSVETALSVQAHPDKKLAEQLHLQKPQVYKDDNHKPEMAVALSDFETLSGFVTTEEIVTALGNVPELRQAVGEECAVALEEAHRSATAPLPLFKDAFTNLMKCNPDTIKTATQALSARLSSEAAAGRELTPKETLVLRLNMQYPDDVGILASFFLNYIVLSPGEGLYMAANSPHAYLSGECVEVMASSDNVVRAGLTPKLRDTDILCAMLTYAQGSPEILRGAPVDTCTRHYQPPFEEFALDIFNVPAGVLHAVPAAPGPSLVLVRLGHGIAIPSLSESISSLSSDPAAYSGPIQGGDVFFVSAGCPFTLEGAMDEGLTVIRCGCSPTIFA